MIDSVLYCLFFCFLKIFTCFTYYINVLYVWTDSTMSCIQFYVLSRRLVLTLSPSLTPMALSCPQSTHRVAMATFWRAFHHDGKISPAW